MNELAMVIVWVTCGVLAAGYGYAFSQREWPATAESERRADTRLAIVIGVTGPIGLLATWLSIWITGHDGHGWLAPGRKP